MYKDKKAAGRGLPSGTGLALACVACLLTGFLTGGYDYLAAESLLGHR